MAISERQGQRSHTSFHVCHFRGYQAFRAPISTMGVKSDIPGNTQHEAGLRPSLPSTKQQYHSSITQDLAIVSVSYEKTPRFRHMSQSHLAASSSNFQLIINNALKAYEKRTKKDLLAHPLAAQLQACDSLSAILAILQQQVQGLDQSRSDDRWTKWLDPTVNVLFAFSATLGAGVGLVSPRSCGSLRFALSYLLGRHSPPPM